MADNAMTHERGTWGNFVAQPLLARDLAPSAAKIAPEARADVAESPAIREIDAAHGALADRRTEAWIIAVLGNADAIRPWVEFS